MCHIPVEVNTTVNNLTCTLDDMQTVLVKLKHKKYKMTQFSENICPTVVVMALYYLIETSAMYQHRSIHIDVKGFMIIVPLVQ